MSRDSAIGIATGYGLEGRGVGVRVAVGQDFSPLHVVQMVLRPTQHRGNFPRR
jgi:hypothetical protein